MTKKPGDTSDNEFLLKKIYINENLNIKEKKILWVVLEGCTGWPIQPISRFLKKMPK